MGESISEYMRRRGREVARFGREAEAAAHEAYGKAIRAGQDLKLSSSGQIVSHGAKLLQEKADRAAAAVSSATQHTKRRGDEALRRAGENPVIRSVAVDAVRGAGRAAGVVRGGVHAVEGLADGAVFAVRLLNPVDRLMSPQGQSADEQLDRATRHATRAVVDYVKQGVADPRKVLEDIKGVGQQWNRQLNPDATPVAPTFAGELRRNFDIGRNQGEVAFDVASLVIGGPAAKAAKGLGRVSNVGNSGKYLAQGFSSKAAAHLALPYPASAMGSHFVARRTRLSPAFGGGRLPKSYLDGPFNRLAPQGISRGDLYELHYAVDSRFYGTKAAGERWSGRDLGLKRHGPLGQIWHGSPAPLKARIGGLSAAVGGSLHNLEGDQ